MCRYFSFLSKLITLFLSCISHLKRMPPGNSCVVMFWGKPQAFVNIYIFFGNYMDVFNPPGNCYTVWGRFDYFLHVHHLPQHIPEHVSSLMKYYQYYPCSPNLHSKICPDFLFWHSKHSKTWPYLLPAMFHGFWFSYLFPNCTQMRPRECVKPSEKHLGKNKGTKQVRTSALTSTPGTETPLSPNLHVVLPEKNFIGDKNAFKRKK